jgi:hypothetical protein
MRPLITSAIIAASLALAGNGAMAADTYAKTGAPAAPAHTAVHVAARHAYPVARYGVARPPVDVAQIISSLLVSPFVAPCRQDPHHARVQRRYLRALRPADLRYLVAAGYLHSGFAQRASGGPVHSGNERHQRHDGVDGSGGRASRR